MQNDDAPTITNYIKKQFLSNIPIKEFSWKEFTNSNIDFQEQVINNTVQLDSVLKFPINIDYQKAFLKQFIQILEQQNSVIHDSVYEEYARLVALPRNNINFKHYALEKITKSIILQEDIHLISEGTTGLRTWQASLALSEWILNNISHFESKRVIELGSGIGLTGLILIQCCNPKTVCLTDCHPSVLKTLCDNIVLNCNKGKYSPEKLCLFKEQINSCEVSVIDLNWENISLELCQKLGQIDAIIAADVVYDKSIFNSLINTVDFLFKYCNVSEFILSCTERNKETLDDFLALLKDKYRICDIPVPTQRNFCWASVPPMKMFSVVLLDHPL